MSQSEIEQKAKFDHIRYAQLWEDADVLISALGDRSGQRLVSICSAGDNALAMLMLNPACVVAIDLSPAQIACLHLRVGALQNLNHSQFLELMGARRSTHRQKLLEQALKSCDDATGEFWQSMSSLVEKYGAGGVGKFERYFRLFRTWVLPLTHRRRTIDQIFIKKSEKERKAFLEQRFDNWRWRLMMRLFFSKAVMGPLGRDRAFFDHVEGSLAEHVRSRLFHAAVTCDPSENPYLHWIMKGHNGDALPMPWRSENYEIIRDRLDRLEIHQGPLEAYLKSAPKVDGFNLSDIFEYMSPDVCGDVYGNILDAANPGARLAYWNMMAPRRVPPAFADRVTRQMELEDELKQKDKAFFYSDFVVEEVI